MGSVDDDRSLAMACLAGDEAAVRRFVERFQPIVYSLCRKMLGHIHDAEDVAQISLLRAIRHLAKWDSARPLKPWVMAIAANRCRTALSESGRRFMAVEWADRPVNNRQATESAEFSEELVLALQSLRPEYRECFDLFYLHEMSVDAVATALDVPEGTVKTWLFRARKELARLLRERGEEPR